MKPKPRRRPSPERFRRLAGALVLLAPQAGLAAGSTSWPRWASLEVSDPELHEVALPTEVLGAARPDLADLRILDPEGMEVPYVVSKPEPAPAKRSPAKLFRAELGPKRTILHVETGATSKLERLLLQSPDPEFIKAATLAGSEDGVNFRVLAEGVPLFRQSGSESLSLDVPLGRWTHFQVQIDDVRNDPVAWTGALVDEAAGPDVTVEPVETVLRSRIDGADATRIELDLGAPNLRIASLTFETEEPLFQRRVSLREVELADDGLRERELHSDLIYAVAAAGGGGYRRTKIQVDRTIAKRDLVIVIYNGDSPPMQISSIAAARRPVLLRFQVAEPGAHRLYVGHHQAGAPRYDVSALASKLEGVPARTAKLGPLQNNPEYRAPEALPDLAELAAEIDVSPWRYRKPITLQGRGVHALELDLDVLSHASADLGDLRLVLQGRQVPYVLEHTSIPRTISPKVEMERDEKRPNISRWRFALPQPRLPVFALECKPVTSLFRREVSLSEQVSDGRGGKYARTLGRSTWEKKSDTKDHTAIVYLEDRPRGAELVLETDNGDNPPLELTDCELSYRAQRLVFKVSQAPSLHYGNAKVARPRYDLSLVESELLAATRLEATLGAEEDVGEKPPFDGEEVMKVEGWIFWAVLASVMIGLLLVIAKLLPKPAGRD